MFPSQPFLFETAGIFQFPPSLPGKWKTFLIPFQQNYFLTGKKTAQAGERDEETKTVESTPQVLLLIQTPSTSE